MLSSSRALFGQCVAEFFGTALIVFFGVGCVASSVLAGSAFSQWEISILWGVAVALAIYCTAGVSGAHLNPAVTLALTFFHGFDKKKVLPYIASQILGAIFASFVVYILYQTLLTDFESINNIVRSDVSGLKTASIFSTYAHPMISVGGAFIVEFSITAALMFIILAVGDEKNGAKRGALAPIIIGLTIAVIGGAFGPLTGFAMNPARDFGPKLFTYFAGWDWSLQGTSDLPYFIIPIFAPILGACFGGWLYPKAIATFLENKAPDAEQDSSSLSSHAQ